MFFTSAEHKQRFLMAIIHETGKVERGKADPEYAAALYILTSNMDTWEQARDYIGRDGIDFADLLHEAHFSGGYIVLIRLAGNLFNDQTECSPVDLMRLDDRNFQVAFTALQLRRVSLPVSEIASEEELFRLEMDARHRGAVEDRDKAWLPIQPGEKF